MLGISVTFSLLFLVNPHDHCPKLSPNGMVRIPWFVLHCHWNCTQCGPRTPQQLEATPPPSFGELMPSGLLTFYFHPLIANLSTPATLGSLHWWFSCFSTNPVPTATAPFHICCSSWHSLNLPTSYHHKETRWWTHCFKETFERRWLLGYNKRDAWMDNQWHQSIYYPSHWKTGSSMQWIIFHQQIPFYVHQTIAKMPRPTDACSLWHSQWQSKCPFSKVDSIKGEVVCPLSMKPLLKQTRLACFKPPLCSCSGCLNKI